MAVWLYQMSQQQWHPSQYRLDIWEGAISSFPYGKIQAGDVEPAPGDRMVFFYAPSGCEEPGVYGWAIVLTHQADDKRLYFRPVAASDILKMRPWWGEDVKHLVDEIRGPMKQGTVWVVPDKLVGRILGGIANWLRGDSGGHA